MGNFPLIAILAEETLTNGTNDQIVDLTPDVCDQRSRRYTATVTGSPVEKGSTASDHRVKGQLKISLIASFHETRLDASGDDPALQGDSGQIAPGSHCLAMDQAWERAHDKDLPLTVYLETGIHEQMFIEAYTPTRGVGDGDSIPFSADLVQVQIFESESGALPADAIAAHKLKQRRSKSKAKRTATQAEMDGRLAREVRAERITATQATGPINAQAVTDQGAYWDATGGRP